MGPMDILQEIQNITPADLHICDRCVGCNRRLKSHEQIARVGVWYRLMKKCENFCEENNETGPPAAKGRTITDADRQ